MLKPQILVAFAVAAIGVLLGWEFIFADLTKVGNPRQVIEVENIGDVADVTFNIYSNQHLEITTVDSDCGCVTTSTLPVQVEPKSEASVHISIDTSKLKLPAQKMFVFYTNPPGRKLFAEVELRKLK